MSQSAALNVIKTHKIMGNQQANDVTGTKSMPHVMNKVVKSTPPAADLERRNRDVNESKPHEPNSAENSEAAAANTAVEPNDARPRYRHSNAYPGRPQLQKFSAHMSRDVEYESKIEKFKTLHEDPQLNLRALKELSWSGIPKKMRAITWRLLSGYLPTSLERRNSILEHKRLNYLNLVEQYFKVESRDEAQQDTFRQIHIDMPRMNPHIQLFQQTLVQEMFERILFIWAIRHPASGYVQGINDLVTPFFIVFLQEALESQDLGACFRYEYEYITCYECVPHYSHFSSFCLLLQAAVVELDTFKLNTLSAEQLNIIEADSFWCLSKFLDCIQDNYIFAQLGIQAKVNQLKELIQRIDGMLIAHCFI